MGHTSVGQVGCGGSVSGGVGHAGVGCVIQGILGWDGMGSCRDGVCHTGVGWIGSCRGRIGCFMQEWVGHTWVRWVKFKC